MNSPILPQSSASPGFDSQPQPLDSGAVSGPADILPEQPRPPGYLTRHAQGRLPLWQSLWVNYIGLTLALCLLSAGLKRWSFAVQAAHQPLWGLFLLLLAMGSFCALFLAVFWGAQGTLLATYDYGQRTGRKVLVAFLSLGVILYGIVWMWGLARVVL